jgi:hypothetical protein
MTRDTSNISVPNEYKRGLSERSQSPLYKGSTYKIEEYRRQLKRYRSILKNIGQAYRDQEMPYSFGPCAGCEAEHWCNSLPSYIAYGLGHKFRGTLYSLTKDDVPQSIVDKLGQNANREIPTLLKFGEIARIELRESWEATAADLGGRSSLDEFIVSCLDLVDKTLITASTSKVVSHAAAP